jgi:hypothetical protein
LDGLALALDCYFPGKSILIDAAGWSDLLLGVVIGALKPPHPMLMERRIPTSSFQPPNFKAKRYLHDANKIIDEVVEVMQPDDETCIKISSEYVLSGAAEHLEKLGFQAQVIESTGDLKIMVEKAYNRWCIEKGVPEEIVADKRRFYRFLDWVGEMPKIREGLVKTGWDSWEEKWRAEIHKPK